MVGELPELLAKITEDKRVLVRRGGEPRAIVGKHDRPWFDRPVFGLVRYMSGESTGKKFDSKRYISLYR